MTTTERAIVYMCNEHNINCDYIKVSNGNLEIHELPPHIEHKKQSQINAELKSKKRIRIALTIILIFAIIISKDIVISIFLLLMQLSTFCEENYFIGGNLK